MEKEIFNIMTSCDYRMYPYVAAMIVSIAENNPNKEIHFYILCGENSVTNLETLEKVEKLYPSVNLFLQVVDNDSDFDILSHYGGTWPNEAYYPLICNRYLPDTVDRILYLDSGDIMVRGDISPFYNRDFNGKSIIAAAPLRYKSKENGKIVLFDNTNVETSDELNRILMGGIFNSGSYMINVAKLREIGWTIDNYIRIIEDLKIAFGDAYPTRVDRLYWGDQALLGVTFLGDIEMFHENPRIIDMEYDTKLQDFAEMELDQFTAEPVITHFCGTPKQWLIDYNDTGLLPDFRNGTIELTKVHPKIRPFYEEWYNYVKIMSLAD